MLAENWSYTATKDERGVHVVLRSNDGTREKTFFLAAPSLEGVIRHMESLTEENCEGFFPRPREKKAKVK